MILVYLWYLVALLSSTVSPQDIYNKIETIAYAGTTTIVGCPGNETFTLPKWSGPPVLTSGSFTPYTLENSDFVTPSKPRISYHADRRSLLINNTELSDAGVYQCYKAQFRLTGENVVTVRVNLSKPEITASVNEFSGDLKASEGKQFIVNCTSRGGHPAPNVVLYQGGINGDVLGNTSVAVDNTSNVILTVMITPQRRDDLKQLQCRSYYPTPASAQDSQLSRPLRLYLYLKPLQPSVTQQPNVITGTNISVECRTSGSRPAATISWTNQDQTHTATTTTINDTATHTFTIVSILRWPVTAADNGQTVMCSVYHMALDNNLTASATLNIQFPVERSTTSITGNRVIVANGTNQLLLNCTTGSSNPPSNITWRNGTDIIPNNNVYYNNTGKNNGVVRSQLLQLTPTRYDHGNNISCSVSNGINQFTDGTAIMLTLYFAPIVTISTPSSLTLTEEPSPPLTVLPCSADSNPSPTITWYHNGVTVTPGILGSSLSYNISGANRTSSGNYTCKADNNVPTGDSKTYRVGVLFRPLKVSMNKSTGDIIANGQTQMSISCASGTSNPVSNITWTTGNIQTGIPSLVDRPGEYGGTVRTSTIRFNPTRDNEGATIKCEASNNVTGQHEVSESTVIDNIIYNPMIVNIPDTDVIEGDTATLPCYASSKPPARFTWSKGSDVLENDLGTVLFNGFNYTIYNSSRSQAGTYTCTADNQVYPSDSKQTFLKVLYPPNITVIAINTTVNNSETNVTCEASGVPDKYTYVRWVHKWNGHVVTHPGPLLAARVLTLTNLSYAHSGVYTCGASNGVKGVSHGTGILQVKSPPIIVGDVANTLEIKTSAQLMKATMVTFQYYSNAGRDSVKVQNSDGTGEDVVDVDIADVDISLPVFLSEINTAGKEAIINITVANMSQFRSYDVVVTNKMGSVRLSLILQPLGPPEPPVFVNSTSLDHQSVIIQWISGFPNGLNQTFVIQLSTDKSTWWNITQYGGMQYQTKYSKKIDSLASNQLYFVRMFAFNTEGESEQTGIFSFKTEMPPNTPTPSPIGLIVGGAGGGVVTAAVVFVVIIVIVRRRKATRMPESAKENSDHDMTSTTNEGYENGDEEVINKWYESAGSCMTDTSVSASTSKLLLADVGNIYAKVNRNPEVVYAMPDKQRGKKMDRQQQKQGVKSQKDGKTKNKHDKNKPQSGDVYENASFTMSGNKSVPGSGEIIYEDTSISVPVAPKFQKPMATDGLLYADLEFAPKKKGPTKIIGIEDRCEYTTIDLTKKAQPLPDSDDEDRNKL